MAQIDKVQLQSYYQNPGDIYSDTKTESVSELIADQHNETDARLTTAVANAVAPGAVDTNKLANRSVTRPKIGVGAVGATELDPALLQNYGDIAVQAKFVKVDAQLADTMNSIGVSIVLFPRLTGETSDIPRFQRAVDYLTGVGGGRLVVPNLGVDYEFKFIPGSTINSPTRVEIRGSNIEIVGVGRPKIKMTGLTLSYLTSIDDYASSGRDIFTAFSIMGVYNCKVIGIEFEGEYTTGLFRYQSPRSIAVAIKGSSNCVVDDVKGNKLLGNLVNIVNSYLEYDAPYALSANNQVSNSQAYDCLENGFNAMGGTASTIISNLLSRGCVNGFESASDVLVASNCIFKANKSSGMALSGTKQILNNIVASESTSDGTNDNGYGLIITGGEDVQVNGGIYNDNYNFGIYIYPGVKKVYIANAEVKRNATTATNKVAIQMVGTVSNRIQDVQVFNCQIEAQGTVIGSIVNYADNVRVLGNYGTFEDSASSFSFSANCNGSRAVGNKFNKTVAMSDPTGEEYNNGLYRYIDRTTIPTTGTYLLGDIINNRQRSQGAVAEWSCIQSGTFGTLNSGATTGSITSGTKTLTVNSATDLYVGCFITVTGVTGVKRVVAISGLTVTLDNAADVTVSGAAISYRAPVVIPSRQNGNVTSIAAAPAYIGQTAVVGGLVYTATGTSSSADWRQQPRYVAAPASASATGSVGDIAADASYLYICYATNTWRRVAHSTW